MFRDIRDPSERVKKICDYATQITEVDVNIPTSRYFRSGKEILRMADVYQSEGSLEKAFILYSKFVILFVEKLPKHPGYKLTSQEEKTRNKKTLQLVFPKAEAIKKQLKEAFQAEEEIKLAEERRLAEKLAREEQQRRDEEENRLRYEEEMRKKLKLDELQEMEDQLERLKMQQLIVDRGKSEEEAINHELADRQDEDGANSFSSYAPVSTKHLPPPPSYYSAIKMSVPEIPDRGLKPSLNSQNDSSSLTSLSRLPSVDRTLKPSISHFTNVGEMGLKCVYVPAELTIKFLNIAQGNTSKNVETCGILCGILEHSTWRITHLLIPNQHGKPDSCDIDNEEDVAEYQDEKDLITLGWIHTHPKTAFLSSVDQHTHWPYQKLLPEALAIVCSPKFNDTGYFYLTPDYGMDLIRNCTGRGFHEHPMHTPIFENCSHVQIDHNASVIIADLRRNSNPR